MPPKTPKLAFWQVESPPKEPKNLAIVAFTGDESGSIR